MNSILSEYFERLKALSNTHLEYFYYERDVASRMPYSVQLRFSDKNGSLRNSWGSGVTKDEAFGKALMELIERLYFSNFSPFEFKNLFGFFATKKTLLSLSNEYQIPSISLHPANTNGIAIHLSTQKAIKAAMLELIERHTILYSLIASIGPSHKIAKALTPKINAIFYVWESPLRTFTVVGSILDQVGSYFSSACDYKLDKAILKAELELNSFIFLKEKYCDDSKIIKDDIQSINRYHKFSGDKSAIHFLENTPPGKLPALDKKRFFYANIPVPDIFKGLYPLPCIRVIHPDVQQLFFDNWKSEYLNPRIFSRDQSLPGFPHIIA